ncbi:hypothetical protein SOJ85_003020 [Cronobacter turicensis]|nr:hypothetical protein [Cronobacter turicensis]
MVEVHTREYPDLKMQAEFTPGIKPGRNGPSVNNQLKVLKSEVSIRLFSQLNDKRCIGFSLDGADMLIITILLLIRLALFSSQIHK